MPFQNLKQVLACIRAQAKNSSWDCHKWAHETDWSRIVKSSKNRTPDEWLCLLSGRKIAQLRKDAEYFEVDEKGTKEQLCSRLAPIYHYIAVQGGRKSRKGSRSASLKSASKSRSKSASKSKAVIRRRVRSKSGQRKTLGAKRSSRSSRSTKSKSKRSKSKRTRSKRVKYMNASSGA